MLRAYVVLVTFFAIVLGVGLEKLTGADGLIERFEQLGRWLVVGGAVAWFAPSVLAWLRAVRERPARAWPVVRVLGLRLVGFGLFVALIYGGIAVAVLVFQGSAWLAAWALPPTSRFAGAVLLPVVGGGSVGLPVGFAVWARLLRPVAPDDARWVRALRGLGWLIGEGFKSPTALLEGLDGLELDGAEVAVDTPEVVDPR